jgi:hypothetical protein
VTADPGWALSSYGMDAAFTSFQPRESGIHAVWPGAGEASVAEVHFRCAPQPTARETNNNRSSLATGCTGSGQLSPRGLGMGR